jgi:hypothetical protein
MISYVPSLPCKPCKSLFQIQNNHALPQVQQLENFITSANLTDIYRARIENINCVDVPLDLHDLVVLVVNPTNLISIQSLDDIILKLKPLARRYYYLAINKFLLYTEHQIDSRDIANFDSKLLSYWQQLVQLDTVWANSSNDDLGELGNFVHPVTNIMFRV